MVKRSNMTSCPREEEDGYVVADKPKVRNGAVRERDPACASGFSFDSPGRYRVSIYREACPIAKEVFGVEGSFLPIRIMDAASIYHVVDWICRQKDGYDAVRLMKDSSTNAWCVSLERTADAPDAEDEIIAEFYVAKCIVR